jgi:hypothetical protein
LGGLLLLITVGAAGWFFWTLHDTRQAVAAALAELDAADPGWRLDDLLAARKPLADDRNGALVIEKVSALLPVLPTTFWQAYEPAMEQWKYPAALPPLLRELLRTEAALLPPAALRLARGLKDMPEGRFSLAIRPGDIDTAVSQIDHTSRVVHWLQIDVALRSLDATADGALESCRAMLNAGRALAEEPFLVSHAVRCRGHFHVLESLERALAQGEASEASLKSLQNLLTREIGDSDWSAALRGERAFVVRTLQILDEQKMSLRQFNARYSPAVPNWRDYITDRLPHSFARYIPAQARAATKMIEAAKLPLHEQDAAIAPILEEVKGQPNVSLMLHPKNMPLIAQSHRRSQTQLRAMVVALACERYRLAKKAWPDSLESLVAAKLLDAVPLDPNDGQPLRYRRAEKGIVVYGVGADRGDNQGIVRHGHEEPAGSDLGIRLRDTPRRGGGP